MRVEVLKRGLAICAAFEINTNRPVIDGRDGGISDVAMVISDVNALIGGIPVEGVKIALSQRDAFASGFVVHC